MTPVDVVRLVEAMPPQSAPPDLRLALVLNGGVSLAVWIGGVVHEIDRLRRSLDDNSGSDPKGYPAALKRRGVKSVRVDVIAGASAGGINGALLGAAIQGAKPLRGANGQSLRDVWLDLGELKRLTRSTRETDPPSLLKGDEYFLPALEETLGGLLARHGRLKHPLYVYLTTTDLRGTREASFTTSDGTIKETDHRVVLRFSAGEEGVLVDPSIYTPADDDEMGEKLPLDAAQLKRLARAARSTSSFPGAFPPHEAVIRRPEDEPERRETAYLVDGGVLDNQPFNPMLDRISIMSVTNRWRRVILYVVPYVTGRDADNEAPAGQPGIKESISAAGLARDLPKLTSLERVERAMADGRMAAAAVEALNRGDAIAHVKAAAPTLYPLYRQVQATELMQTVKQWCASPRSVGTGPLGRNESTAADVTQVSVSEPGDLDELAMLLPPPTWSTAITGWIEPGAFDQETFNPEWCWGLSKAERFSHIALQWLRDGSSDQHSRARTAASNLNLAVRGAMAVLRETFYDLWELKEEEDQTSEQALATFIEAHRAIGAEYRGVRERFDTLVFWTSRALDRITADEVRERLAGVEVVANAAGTRAAPPPCFDFYRVNAGERVLGHASASPEQKLAGMQLGHFAAFLKHSWRANDWMWGRLDGVTWLGRMLFDGDAEDEVRRRDSWIWREQVKILREELPALARAVDRDEAEQFSATADLALWRKQYAPLLADLAEGSKPVGEDEVIGAFQACRLSDDLVTEETRSRAGILTITRLAAVASRALSGTRSDLPAPVRAIVGTTRRLTGLTNSLAATFARAPAVGVALVCFLAAFAVVLAIADDGGAWLSPALVGLALLGAWSSYGWLSSPPNFVRGILQALLLGVLTWFAASELAPPGDLSTWVQPDGAWDVVWLLALGAAVAGSVLVLVYVVAPLIKQPAAARAVRAWLGYTLLILLAAGLLKIGWDEITEVKEEGGDPAWKRLLISHELLRVSLVTVVVACVLVPLAELFSSLFKRSHPRAGS